MLASYDSQGFKVAFRGGDAGNAETELIRAMLPCYAMRFSKVRWLLALKWVLKPRCLAYYAVGKAFLEEIAMLF